MSEHLDDPSRIHEAKLAPGDDLLQYRTRDEAEGISCAYRIVGWFILMYAGADLVGNFAMQLVVMGQGVAWLARVAQLGMLSMSVPLAIGGIGMIRTRSWGAVLASATQGLLALTTSLMLAFRLNAIPTIGDSLIVISYIRGSLLQMAIAFLPYAIWRLCRRRGVFSVVAP